MNVEGTPIQRYDGKLGATESLGEGNVGCIYKIALLSYKILMWLLLQDKYDIRWYNTRCLIALVRKGDSRACRL